MDISTLQILEDYLDRFRGIVIVVSHDRYFMDRVVRRIFSFEEGGVLCQHEGGYTDYIEAKQRRFGETQMDLMAGKKAAKTESSETKSSSKDWKQNRPVKLKFTFKEQKEFETIDDDIAALEEKIEKLDADMMANATNSKKLGELMAEKEAAEAELEEKMDRWVYLNDLAERIEAQKANK